MEPCCSIYSNSKNNLTGNSVKGNNRRQGNASHRLQIGFAYDEIGNDVDIETENPVSAEYEDTQTLNWIRETLRQWGNVIDLPYSPTIVEKILNEQPDIIFNITEAYGGRNRESLVPAMAQIMDIPFTGSDAMSLGLSLDKRLTKLLATQVGIPTPAFILLRGPEDIKNNENHIERIGYPLMAKPNCGGSSMGITRESKIHSVGQLVEVTRQIRKIIDDDILVEKFISGREYTAGLIQRCKLMHLPLAETRFRDGGPEAFYSIEMKSVHDKEVICPADCSESTATTIQEYAKRVFEVLGCKDLARIDFRVDSDGVPQFLEINPLPGLSPYYSIYPMQAKAAGMEPEDIIRQLLINNLPLHTGEIDGQFVKLELASHK